MGEFALNWTSLSQYFVVKQIRPQVFALAFNLGNFLRRLTLLVGAKQWLPATVRGKLVRIGAKNVRHARYVTFQMAETGVLPDSFRGILAGIRSLADTVPVPSG